eukprot:GHRR01019875.1.p2 GENE.GHRR01019875.1~~GHRR01019875.1.p2  ORF type:complete len:135 (+),score=26.37 GHRR01019875.1:707-1111(+)
MLPMFMELAMLLPNHHIDLHMVGPRVPDELHGQTCEIVHKRAAEAKQGYCLLALVVYSYAVSCPRVFASWCSIHYRIRDCPEFCHPVAESAKLVQATAFQIHSSSCNKGCGMVQALQYAAAAAGGWDCLCTSSA